METIDFFEDEDGELPAPMTQKDVILLNRAGAFQDEDALPQADGDKKDDDAMEVIQTIFETLMTDFNTARLIS